jgi:para-nitrobenzyl esterase
MAIDNRVVETTYGPVRGTDDGRIRTWKGLRYAAPPVCDLRFRAPEPPERWTEVADATSFGPACPATVVSQHAPRLGGAAERRMLEAEHLGIG